MRPHSRKTPWLAAATALLTAAGSCTETRPTGPDLSGTATTHSDVANAATNSAHGSPSGDASASAAGAGCVSITTSHHPDGYAAPQVHGPHAKLRVQDCRVCHGYDLEGCTGAPSCDSCHQPGWRGTCTYCHGGDHNSSGAPPRGLDVERDLPAATFAAHTAHVEGTMHDGFDCSACHAKPAHALTPGHMFDETHGLAEVDFTGGLSPSGVYDGSGTCSEVYCHGNGRTAGEQRYDDPAATCTSCHGDLDRTDNLSAGHGRHFHPVATTVAPVSRCSSCHPLGIERNGGRARIVAGLDAHVNGTAEVVLSPTTAEDTIEPYRGAEGELRCRGICHGIEHGPSATDGTDQRSRWTR